MPGSLCIGAIGVRTVALYNTAASVVGAKRVSVAMVYATGFVGATAWSRFA
jgi:hypothetical protein